MVDGDIILADPDILRRIYHKSGLPFITAGALADIESIASRPGPCRDAANTFLQELHSKPAEILNDVPPGGPLVTQDKLQRRSFQGSPVYVLERRASAPTPAQFVIALCRDYDMVVLCRSTQLQRSVEAAGFKAARWSPRPLARTTEATRKNALNSTAPHPTGAARVQPFALCSQPIREADTQKPVSHLPGSGDTVRLADGAAALLGRQISAGGEGTIYELPGSQQVCKIYHREKLTQLKQRKIELMVSRRIERPGICWPSQTVSNAVGEFVGYSMPRATGQTMQSTMFVKPRLEQTFPLWTRVDLVNVAGTFIDHIEFLHRHNIIVGDINPMNLLVTSDSTKVWMVDTDSFQIEAFPCPVGTVNFTPTEIQGRNYADFLRTKEHELFAVATMIFMILFPGKAPYSQQGGGSPADNIKSKHFPYRFYAQAGPSAPEVSGEDAPQGPWQYIWSHLPQNMRQAFFETFRDGTKRTSVAQWTQLLLNYQDRLLNQSISNEMFPLSFPVRDPMQVSCGKCAKPFTCSKRYAERLTNEGKTPWCPACHHRIRLERLARDSRKAMQEAVGTPQPTIRPASASANRRTPPPTSPGYRQPMTPSGAHQPASPPRPAPPRPHGNQAASSSAPTLTDLVGRLLSQLFK